MTEFLTTALTFPTLPWSILLAFCTLYWLLAATGLVDDAHLDGLLGGDHAAAVDGGDGHADASVLAGILARLGLGGVPVMLVLAVLAFFGWMSTYFVHLLLLQHAPATLRVLAGIATALLAVVPAVLITSLLLRPVRKLLVRLRPLPPSSILGKVGVVVSPTVDGAQGRASFDDGGAGLMLQVRADPGKTYARGDRVVLIAFDDSTYTHRVIAEHDFNRY